MSHHVGGNVLEEFLEGTKFLSSSYQRICFLLREVDSKSALEVASLKRAQDAHLEYLSSTTTNKRSKTEESVLIAKVQHMYQRLCIRNEERRALVEQMKGFSENQLTRLNADLATLHSELKRNGELEDEEEQHFFPLTNSYSLQPQQQQQSTPAPPIPILPTPSAAATSLISSAPSSSSASTAAAATQSSSLETILQPGMWLTSNWQDELWNLSRYVESAGKDMAWVVDADNDSQRFKVPLHKLKILPPENEELAQAKLRLVRGSTVLAMYPDTTTFYPAVVAQAPFRNTSLHPAEYLNKVCVTCEFADDEDETTKTPKRLVPVQYVVTL